MMFRLLIVLFIIALIAGPANAGEHKPKTSDTTEVANLSADQYLSQKVNLVLSQIGQAQLDADAREHRFRALVMEIFDARFISQFVLGAHWKETSPTEQTRFTKSLIELQVQSWAQRFKPSINANAVAIGVPQVNDRGHHIVPMKVKDADTPDGTVKLLWVLRKQDDAFKVFDVIVGGTSILVTYRNEYQSFISRHGSVAKLTDEIEKQVRLASTTPAN